MENQVQTSIVSWLKRVEQKISERGWRVCPACGEEWTNLLPCRFLKFDDETGRTTQECWGLCVECGESVKAFDWISERMPIPGAAVEVKWQGPRTTKVKLGDRIDEMEHVHNRYAVVTVGIQMFVVTSKSGGPVSLKADGVDKIQFASNSLAAWSKIGHILRNPTLYDTVDEETKYEQVEKRVRQRR